MCEHVCKCVCAWVADCPSCSVACVCVHVHVCGGVGGVPDCPSCSVVCVHVCVYML